MGRACGSSMPGPGAKGTGTVAVRNYEAWQSIRLDLDTICENKPVDTRYTFFGQQYDLPVFAGPVGATKLHYGEKYDDQAYNSILVPACAQAGIAAFTGDGTDPAVFTAAARAIGASGGKGIPTVNPGTATHSSPSWTRPRRPAPRSSPWTSTPPAPPS